MMLRALFFRENFPPLILLMVFLLHSVSNVFSDTTIQGDLFLFPDVQITNTSGSGATDDVEENRIKAGIDLFYSYKDTNLALMLDFFNQREVVGLRFDVFSKYALALEARQGQVLVGQINYVALLWSVLLP